MQIRQGVSHGLGGRSYPVLLALICLLLTGAQGALVEFEPPFTISLPNTSFARILVANRALGEVEPQVAPYVLTIPPGLTIPYPSYSRTGPGF
jgi:hypothetical protein